MWKCENAKQLNPSFETFTTAVNQGFQENNSSTTPQKTVLKLAPLVASWVEVYYRGVSWINMRKQQNDTDSSV